MSTEPPEETRSATESKADTNYTAEGSTDSKANVDGEKKERAKPVRIESVGQLIRDVYWGGTKRQKLTKPEIAALRAKPELLGADREELFRISLSDLTLEKTRNLLLIVVGLDAPIVATKICEFIREAMCNHPVFRADALSSLLRNLPDAASEEQAIQLLTSQDYALLRWPEGSAALTKRAVDQCRTNAVQSLLLLLWASGRIPIQRILRILSATVWTAKSRQRRTEADKVRSLITAKEVVAPSVTHDLLSRKLQEQAQSVDAARRRESAASSRAAKLHEELTEVERQLALTRDQLDALRREIGQLAQAREADIAHSQDDYERLRGQVLHRLREELRLLDDGLHALRRDPPKVHVMIDHAERAIDGLKREMEKIRGSD